MSLRFCSIASGSSGNSYLVRTDSTAIVIDAGVTARKIIEGLTMANTDPDEVKALLITHEHTDHINGVPVTANRLGGASVFASRGTWEGVSGGSWRRNPRPLVSEERKESFAPGDIFTVGDIKIQTVPLSHDAMAPAGYVLRSAHGEGSVSLITDTGIFTKRMTSASADADIFVIEANHDVDMLVRGRYPDFLKQRILSKTGHLSNEAAADALLRVMALKRKKRCVLLAHLSAENNTPATAEETVTRLLAESNYHNGRDLYIGVLPRSRVSMLFEI
ncbi:MAG: MBL fold metallo-hydrolase [Clostridiales Family XIII bacterium]|jgi:phosphoribosyl 1,2-cyclic phosphodiesterase|nr:MBL fold metallo-hydrolase [Clostridiales Family XIII bacterium]